MLVNATRFFESLRLPQNDLGFEIEPLTAGGYETGPC